MKQIDLVMLFALLIVSVLFGMQNSDPATVSFVPGLVQVQAPLVIELLFAAGVGAVFAWVYSLWRGMEFGLVARKKSRDLQEKQQFIEELQKAVQEMETKLKQLPPSKRADAGLTDEDLSVEATQVEDESTKASVS
jgi:uncharacterized integral membrane protein